jgi:hypothetical protein
LNSRHQPLSHVPGSLRVPHKKGRHATSPSSARFKRGVIDPNASGDTPEEDPETNKHHHRKPADEAELRVIQERMLLQSIPQNTIPFNLLNIRSLKRNSPVKSKKVSSRPTPLQSFLVVLFTNFISCDSRDARGPKFGTRSSPNARVSQRMRSVSP